MTQAFPVCKYFCLLSKVHRQDYEFPLQELNFISQVDTLQQCATFGSHQLTMSLRKGIFVPFVDGLHIHWLVKGLFGFF